MSLSLLHGFERDCGLKGCHRNENPRHLDRVWRGHLWESEELFANRPRPGSVTYFFFFVSTTGAGWRISISV